MINKALFISTSIERLFACYITISSFLEYNLFDCDIIISVCCDFNKLTEENKKSLDILKHTNRSVKIIENTLFNNLERNNTIKPSKWGAYVIGKFQVFELLNEYETILMVGNDVVFVDCVEEIMQMTCFAGRKSSNQSSYKNFFDFVKTEELYAPNGDFILINRCNQNPNNLLKEAMSIYYKLSENGYIVDELVYPLLAYKFNISFEFIDTIYNSQPMQSYTNKAKVVHFLSRYKYWENPLTILAFPEINFFLKKWLRLGGESPFKNNKCQNSVSSRYKVSSFILCNDEYLDWSKAIYHMNGLNTLIYAINQISSIYHNFHFSFKELSKLKVYIFISQVEHFHEIYIQPKENFFNATYISIVIKELININTVISLKKHYGKDIINLIESTINDKKVLTIDTRVDYFLECFTDIVFSLRQYYY